MENVDKKTKKMNVLVLNSNHTVLTYCMSCKEIVPIIGKEVKASGKDQIKIEGICGECEYYLCRVTYEQ